MKTDKNTIIGFVLLALLFFVFFWYNNKNAKLAEDYGNRQKFIKDSIEASKVTPAMKAKALQDSLTADSLMRTNKGGKFKAALGTEKQDIVENDVMKLVFTNKGGILKHAYLKNYKSFDSSLIRVGNEKDTLGYRINTGNNNSALTTELFFTNSGVQKNADGSQTVTYVLKDSAGKSIEHIFTINPKDYMIKWDVKVAGAQQIFSNGTMNFVWKSYLTQHEKSAKYERQVSNIGFVENGDFDYIMAKTEHTFEKPTHWLSISQQFFNSTLIADNKFNNGKVVWVKNAVDTSRDLANVDAVFQATISGNTATVPFKLYFGPNDYTILKKQGMEMDRIVNLGRDMYSFVRPINQYVLMPVFNFFATFLSNYGWVILLLTLFIRLITAPLMYGSYMSGAKMKALRPELDTLKKKFGADQQGFAMEQMKLFREAGVNPLGGCIPALLQIPIFFALYSFFNSNIALRGESFLWSKDLSVYDSILTWNAQIPGLGNHLSLFTITAVITSFLISIYNMASTPTQDNPAMKYMPYIFPFILFFVFNGLPSALTWYYTVSNVITLALQFVIQNYIIDHDKVLANIEEKRKAPKKVSKWQERMAQIQESQKKMQDIKNKK